MRPRLGVEFKQTKKNLLRGEFKDRYGAECSIQESSLPGEECLWLGVDVDFDGREVRNGRMHLTREQARKLIPMLRHFVRCGALGIDEPREHFQVGAWVVGVGEENRGVEGRIVQLQKGHYVAVQDHTRPGPEGTIKCTWEQADLIWVPIEIPDNAPTRYDRILENANADD